MGRDREIDVTFADGSADLTGYEEAIKMIQGVNRCVTEFEEGIPTCKIFHSEESSVMENMLR